MSPAALALPAPRRRGLLLFRQHFGGEGEAGAPRGAGRRVPGARRPASLVQPQRPGGGGHSGRLSQSPPLQPTPALAGAHTPGCAQRGVRSVFRDSPPGPPETWAHALTHARTQMPAPPPTHLRSHGHTYVVHTH